MAEDTSSSFAQATSLQLTGCAIQEHLLKQKGLHRQGSVLLWCGVKVFRAFCVYTGITRGVSPATAQLGIHGPTKLHLCDFGMLSDHKGVSVPAGTRGFHGSEKVWGAHTCVLCLFCLVSLKRSLEMNTVQSILQGYSTHQPLHTASPLTALVGPM